MKDMKLTLKGGEPLKVKDKKIKKQKKASKDANAVTEEQVEEVEKHDPTKPKLIAASAVDVVTGKTYEEVFDLEIARAKVSSHPKFVDQR